MVEACKAVGLPEPQYGTDGLFVWITFKRPESMQNVQNASEIQQRVINLVELYRTKVGKESKIVKDAKENYDFGEKGNEEMAMEAFAEGEIFFGGIFGEGPHTEVWTKHLRVNEQLPGRFYALAAGKKAEKETADYIHKFQNCG